MFQEVHLNTLYVSVQDCNTSINNTLWDLNTLYVSVQDNTFKSLLGLMVFKYIICISSRVAELIKTSILNLFKYIICISSSSYDFIIPVKGS